MGDTRKRSTVKKRQICMNMDVLCEIFMRGLNVFIYRSIEGRNS